MTIPTLRPRVMRTQAGIAAARSMQGVPRVPSTYDPAMPRSETMTTAQGAQGPLRQGDALPTLGGPQGRIQPLPGGPRPSPGGVRPVQANAGRRSVSTTYAAGGQPLLPGMAVGGRRPAPQPNRPTLAQGSFSDLMARATALAGQGPRPTQQTMSVNLPAQAATQPAPQPAQQGAAQQPGTSAGGSGANRGGPQRSNKRQQPEEGERPEDAGIATGGGGLAADADGDGQADNPALRPTKDTDGDGVPDEALVDDTVENEIETKKIKIVDRAERIEYVSGYKVDRDTGDVFYQGGHVGNVLDEDWWQGALNDHPDARLERDNPGYEEAHPDGPAPETPEDILAEILGWDAAQESDAALQEKIAANRAETQYAQAQAMQNALGAGARARMGAGWMAGTAGDLSAQGNIAAAQQAADLRLEHERRNVAAQMDLLNKQYGAILAMAGYSDNDAARKAAADLQAAQASLQMRLDELNYQRSQQIGWKDILGLGGNMLGTGLGMLAGRYLYGGNGGG